VTLKETLRQLKSLGDAKVRAQNAKQGAGDNQFGVSLGEIRVVAKKLRTNHELALALGRPGLSRFEGLHLTLRPNLDRLHGEPARLNLLAAGPASEHSR